MNISFNGGLTAALVSLLLAGCAASGGQAPNAAQPNQVMTSPGYNQPDAQQESQGTAKADPQHRAKIHTELGALYFQAGHPAVALDHLAMAIAADASYFEAYSVRGLVRASLKEYGKAEADFRQALERAPSDPEVNNNYGWFLCEIGKRRESIPYFMKALQNPLYQTPGRAYTNAGTCALKAGNLDEAQSFLLKAVQVSPDGAVPARLQLAHLFYQRGNLEESRVYLKEALRQMEPPSADALWLGLRVERKRGDRGAEGGYAAQLRSRYPTSAEYQAFLKGDFE